jgi:hypothetical protein
MAPVAASMRIGGMMDVDTRAPVEGSCRPNGRKDRWQGGRQAFQMAGFAMPARGVFEVPWRNADGTAVTLVR